MATAEEILEEPLGPAVAETDSLKVVFTWAVPIPLPITWRAHFMPRDDGASLDMPQDMGRDVGVWGETAVYQIMDRTGTLRVRFLPSGPTAGLIELARQANLASLALGGPANKGPLSIIDANAPGRAIVTRDAMLLGPCRRWTLSSGVYVHEYEFSLDGVHSFLAPLLG